MNLPTAAAPEERWPHAAVLVVDDEQHAPFLLSAGPTCRRPGQAASSAREPRRFARRASA